MLAKGLSPEYQLPEIDPISQIVTPAEDNLVYLKSDTRRIGAQRIPEFAQRKRMEGAVEFVTDFYGCDWRRDPEKICTLTRFPGLWKSMTHFRNRFSFFSGPNGMIIFRS